MQSIYRWSQELDKKGHRSDDIFFPAKAQYEVKAGKGAVIAINGQIKELMTVRVDGNQAVVQRIQALNLHPSRVSMYEAKGAQHN